MAESDALSLDSDTYDVVILGTGLSEAILSGALSRVGKRVLHLDGNDYYGGSYASFSLQSFKSFIESAQKPPQPTAADDENFEVDGKTVVGVPTCRSATSAASFLRPGAEFTASSDEILSDVRQGRRYNIDVTPRAIWSVNPTVEVLVRAGVNRYLEFKALDHTYVFLDGKIQQVPCSKGDIFKSKTITVLEKRQLMKLITALTKPEESDKAEIEAAANTPFIDFLTSRGLSQNLKTFIMYSIAMIGPDQRAENVSKVSTAEGVESMMRFLRSLGRYGNTPLIYPLFGMSDLSQAFCRFAAVYGAVFILGQSATRILLDNNDSSNKKVCGIVCGSKQVVKTPFIVASSDHVPTFISENENQSFLSRFVCAVDKTIDPDGTDALLFATIPPRSSTDFNNQDTIFIMQLDSSTSCVPTGKFLIHLWTQGSESSSQSLRAVANALFRSKETPSESDSRPTMEWMASFDQRVRSATEQLPEGLIVVPDPQQSIDPDSCFQSAKSIFQRMFPDEEFIPEVPHPDDVKWGADDENNEEQNAESTSNVEQQDSTATTTSAPADDMPAPASFD